MKNLDKQYLISIKSIFELKNDFSNVNYFLSKLSDKQLANRINSEIKLMNYGKVISKIDNYLFDKKTQSVLFEMIDIKVFDFDSIKKETIEKIKEKIGIEKFDFYPAQDENGNETTLLRHWDNLNRFAIVIKRELSNKINENPKLILNVKKEIVLANLGYYTRFTIERHEDFKKSYYNYYDSSNWLADASGTDDPEVMNDVYWNLD